MNTNINPNDLQKILSATSGLKSEELTLLFTVLESLGYKYYNGKMYTLNLDVSFPEVSVEVKLENISKDLYINSMSSMLSTIIRMSYMIYLSSNKRNTQAEESIQQLLSTKDNNNSLTIHDKLMALNAIKDLGGEAVYSYLNAKSIERLFKKMYFDNTPIEQSSLTDLLSNPNNPNSQSHTGSLSIKDMDSIDFLILSLIILGSNLFNVQNGKIDIDDKAPAILKNMTDVKELLRPLIALKDAFYSKASENMSNFTEAAVPQIEANNDDNNSQPQ